MTAEQILLSAAIATMDVPETRKDVTTLGNIQWLMRNLGITNRDHPDFGEATILLKQVVRQVTPVPAVSVRQCAPWRA